VVRLAGPDDLAAVARLLHDFNTDYSEPSPGPQALETRLGALLATGETKVLIAGDGPDGLALLRFRTSLWSPGLECYLGELYVVPALRGRGIGRALMAQVITLARSEGADYIELNTGEDDVAARRLYESLGFFSGEGGPGGPPTYYYELDLRDGGEPG
jgi:ribosomal protein S18 acetylase RimI-like enzyme